MASSQRGEWASEWPPDTGRTVGTGIHHPLSTDTRSVDNEDGEFLQLKIQSDSSPIRLPRFVLLFINAQSTFPEPGLAYWIRAKIALLQLIIIGALTISFLMASPTCAPPMRQKWYADLRSSKGVPLSNLTALFPLKIHKLTDSTILNCRHPTLGRFANLLLLISYHLLPWVSRGISPQINCFK